MDELIFNSINLRDKRDLNCKIKGGFQKEGISSTKSRTLTWLVSEAIDFNHGLFVTQVDFRTHLQSNNRVSDVARSHKMQTSQVNR